MLAELTFSESIWIEIVKAIATLLATGVLGLIVWRYQHNVERVQRDLETTRERTFQDQQRIRLDATRTRERELDLERSHRSMRADFVQKTSALAGSLYMATQVHYRQSKHSKVFGRPDNARLDDIYVRWAIESESLENQLKVWYGWDGDVPELWHQVKDLLTVRYFWRRLDGAVSDELLKVNALGYEGKRHSGLTKLQLADPTVVLSTYHSTMMEMSKKLTFDGLVPTADDSGP